MKAITIERFKHWAKTHSDNEKFCSDNRVWTKAEFEQEFLGVKPKKAAKQINIDIKVKQDADVESTLETGHTEESGE